MEPSRSVHLLYLLNTLTRSHPNISQIATIVADIFVFSYPVLLVGWYIKGMRDAQSDPSSKSDFKYLALNVFATVVITVMINIILQHIFPKDRPMFSHLERMHHIPTLLKELPSASFPSDHAGVGMAMAFAAWFHSNTKTTKYIAYALLGTAILMSVARVATGVHRPTDILAGRWVALCVARLIAQPQSQHILRTYIYRRLIWVEVRSIQYLGWYNRKSPSVR